jgi:photosystem II stability/assembly factor-like uncharacterized protein
MTWERVEVPNHSPRVVADQVNPSRFYFYREATGEFWASDDGARSFRALGRTAPRGSTRICTVPEAEGHVWVALQGGGLARSADGGRTFSIAPRVDTCAAVGVGKPAPGSAVHTVFIWGKVTGGPLGVHRSTDGGETWQRVNDDAHEYGGPANGHFIVGDLNVFGRVYMSTAGRGIVFGEPAP